MSFFSYIPKLVIDANDEKLLASPTLKRVKEFVLSIPIDSAPGSNGSLLLFTNPIGL